MASARNVAWKMAKTLAAVVALEKRESGAKSIISSAMAASMAKASAQQRENVSSMA
jgi:hypothetical protein